MAKRRHRKKVRRQPYAQNVVGRQIMRLRFAAGLTQEQFTARCNRVGFDITRGTLAKIEASVRCVTDIELILLAKALRVGIVNLYPMALRPARRR